MELTVRSQDLVRELSLAQGVTDKKTTIPILSNVLLEAAGDSLTLTATDLELSVQSSCPAQVALEGSTTLPMRRLFDYVRLLPDAELALSSTPAATVNLSCGRAKTRLAGIERKNFPQLPAMPEPLTRIGAATLADAVQKTIISVAGEESHYTLAGAQLVLQNDSLTIVSTDGHRLSLYVGSQKLDGLAEEVRGLLPRKGMAELARVLAQGDASSNGEEPASVDFAVDKHHMFFRCGRRLFISRKMTGKFPDYTRVLPKDLSTVLELDREALALVLRRVSQFSDERSHVVRLDLEDGKLEFRATLSAAGASEESLLVDYSGEPFGVGFNARYILDFLSVCSSEKVLMRLSDARSAAQFEIPGSGKGMDYRYVIMPIRV
jgi:DNA polymerase-3 subunit beta